LLPCRDIRGVSADHKLYEVVSFRIVRPYKLAIQFNDGLSQVADLDGLLEGELYGPLKDPALFRQVRLDPDLGNLVWPNGADLIPRSCMIGPNEEKLCSRPQPNGAKSAPVVRRHGDVSRQRLRSSAKSDVMAKHSKGLDARTRDKGGEIREKRGDTLVGTLRKHYGESFAPGVSGRMKLETLLKKEKASSLSELLKKHKKQSRFERSA
jgi:hypothetical protein